MMLDVVASFSTVMTWLALGLSLIGVVLLGLAAWHLPQDRYRALLGVVAMTLVVIATGSSLLLLSQNGHPWTQLLLSLAAPLLMVSLYRLSFPPLAPAFTAHRETRHHLLLLLLTIGALVTTGGLVLLDLLFP
jgi:hypothetical protein